MPVTNHVYEEGNLVWDAMLNQTNVDNNNNKFFRLQLLKDNETNNFSVLFRWGRVGYRGQDSLTPFGEDLEKAKLWFTTKFHDKTGNSWADKDNFKALRKKYTFIPMDYNVKRDEASDEDKEAEDAQEKSSPPESKLDEIQELTYNVQTIQLDSSRSPLGKLTSHQIAAGYRILEKLKKQILDNELGKEHANLVDEYYTNIPHNFGFRQKPPLINTVEMVEKETAMLQDLEHTVKSSREAKKIGE